MPCNCIMALILQSPVTLPTVNWLLQHPCRVSKCCYHCPQFANNWDTEWSSDSWKAIKSVTQRISWLICLPQSLGFPVAHNLGWKPANQIVSGQTQGMRIWRMDAPGSPPPLSLYRKTRRVSFCYCFAFLSLWFPVVESFKKDIISHSQLLLYCQKTCWMIMRRR